MKKIYTLIFLLTILSCKKSNTDKGPVLKEIEFRIVNNGDPNVRDFLFMGEIKKPGAEDYYSSSYTVFQDIKPFDTVSWKYPANTELINAERKFYLKIWYRKKVYSPLLHSVNLIVEGDPYAFGWSQARAYAPDKPDTVSSIDKKIYYINWPADTLTKLKEVF